MNFADALPAFAILAACVFCAWCDFLRDAGSREARTALARRVPSLTSERLPLSLEGRQPFRRAGGATARGGSRGTAPPRAEVRETRIGTEWW